MKTRTGGAVPIMNQYDVSTGSEMVPCLLGIRLARENEAVGSWGQEIHILHVNI